MTDEPFEPHLGRMGFAGSSRGGKYLHRVLASAARSGMPKRSGRRAFTGSRIGRGAVSAVMLGMPRSDSGARRAIVKTRLVRLKGNALGAARAHLSYVQRDGVSRDGEGGGLYSAAEEDCDGRSFLKRCAGDRHQFRLIVSAEDGAQYEDLRPLIRRFMARMEQDLGTELDWVAADHNDTLHPHTHIMLRGRDDAGGNLVIAPGYIKAGMRERLAELVSLDLGPRTGLEVRAARMRDITAERMTVIDRRLLLEMDGGRVVAASSGHSAVERAIRAGRLRKLGRLGLAQALRSGRWRLHAELEARLKELGERGDIIRSLQRALAEASLERSYCDQAIFPSARGASITGRLVARGLADELTDRHYLVIDGLDGRAHYVDIGRGDLTEPLPPGALVRVSAREPSDQLRLSGQPVEVELVSAIPLDRLPGWEGATWLDRKLTGEDSVPIRDAGLGREVRAALALRRQWLLDRGLASDESKRTSFAPGLIAELERRELRRTAVDLAKENGKTFVEFPPKAAIEGVIRRRLDLASGSFALVETRLEFALVPWEPGLERAIGRQISGIARGGGAYSWTLGRRGPQR